jgi:hypothetical protein
VVNVPEGAAEMAIVSEDELAAPRRLGYTMVGGVSGLRMFDIQDPMSTIHNQHV